MARRIRREPKVYSRKHRSNPSKMENHKRTSLLSERKDWKCAICPVCLEFPHNAVLLLCSSHDNGCRPYICGTSFRFSNCLEQFQKAYTENETSSRELVADNWDQGWPAWKKSVAMDLLKCPLCRGQVKGWTIVEPARAYLNKKKRGCVQDNCSFIGRFKQLRKHVRAKHPSAKRRSVDPVLEKKWKVLENQIEQEDVISTIRSAMPNSVVMGDYVIDFNHSDGYDSEDYDSDDYHSDSFDAFDDSDSDDESEEFERPTQNILVGGTVHNRRHGSWHMAGRSSRHLYGVNRPASHPAATYRRVNSHISFDDEHGVVSSRRSSYQ